MTEVKVEEPREVLEGRNRAEASAETGAAGPSAHDDHIPTTRLPPIAPPPRPRSVPPPPASAVESAGPESTDELTRVRQASFAPPPRAGVALWWKTLVASLARARLKVAPVPGPPHPRALERGLGATCAGVGVALAAIALVAALRGAPPEAPPVVTAALALARAIVAAALLGFSLGLLFLGERLFVGPPPTRGSRQYDSPEGSSESSRPDRMS